MGASVSSLQVLSDNKEVLRPLLSVSDSFLLLAGYPRQVHSLGRAGLQCRAVWLAQSSAPLLPESSVLLVALLCPVDVS